MWKILKASYHWTSDWRIWLTKIPFSTQPRFHFWIIPASIPSVQIYFWLVVNVASYFVFSLQTDVTWSLYVALIGIPEIHFGKLQKKLSDIPPEGIMWRNCRQWMKQSLWQLWDVRKICFSVFESSERNLFSIFYMLY